MRFARDATWRWLGATAAAMVVASWTVLSCSGSSGTSDGGADAAADVRRKDVSTGGPDASSEGSAPEGGAEGGTPYLVELAVSSSSAPSLTLVPAFSPTTYDYYVRCPAASNGVKVQMKASPGAVSQLEQPSPSSGTQPSQTVSATVKANEALVAVASSGSASTEYWVRCLPKDFPELAWDPHTEAGAASPGYYLVGSFLVNPGEGGYAMVLDRNGVPVWYLLASDGQGVFNVDEPVDGSISFVGSLHTARYEIHDLASGAVTAVPRCDEHELQIAKNGHYFIFQEPFVYPVDLTGLAVSLNDGGTLALGPGGTIRSCRIQEIDPKTGKTVWEWEAQDHLDPVKDTVDPEVVPGGIDGGIAIQPYHCNAIDIDEANGGNILLSARNMDSVLYIEKSSKRILWKLGGAAYTHEDAAYISVADPFHRQHDGRLITWTQTCSGASGQLSVFDDESALKAPARAVLYDVAVTFAAGGAPSDCGVPGEAGTGDAGAGDSGAAEAGTATVSWQYVGSIHSASLGSFRILPDGSHIIGWGWRQKDDKLTFTETGPAGTDLLDFTLDPTTVAGNYSYRAIKVPLTALDLNVMRHAVH